MNRQTEIRFVKGVGPVKAGHFAKLGVKTVGDLLEFYPRNYRFAPSPTKIADMQVEETVTLVGDVRGVDCHSPRLASSLFSVILNDGSAACTLIWFNGRYLRGQIRKGMTLTVFGKVSVYNGSKQLNSPQFIVGEQSPEEFNGGIYPATAKLTSNATKAAVKQVLKHLDDLVDEYENVNHYDEGRLISRIDAVEWMHNPKTKAALNAARKGLKYDEFLLMQLGLAMRRQANSVGGAPVCGPGPDNRWHNEILSLFPFKPTDGQIDAVCDIEEDMCGNDIPMNRLLQGDVGCGKSAVAIYAAMLAVHNGLQVAIMAPTETLARQWASKITEYLGNDTEVHSELVLGGDCAVLRSWLREDTGNGSIDIIVGTTALLNEDIKFSNLGLVIIDEQHKFGVHQRAALRKNSNPHCLVMTPTPIPRTLAMTAFGDLDVSIIKDHPPGRGGVITYLIGPDGREQAYTGIRERLRLGRQVFVVCPKIGEYGDSLQTDTVKVVYEGLRCQFFDFNVGLLHGRMPSDDKQHVMDRFRSGDIDILVCTTVIEVGVDVPNATVMVIEEADRFGLAQLHQLRGRLCRGPAESDCLLFTNNTSEAVQSRMEIMCKTNDGFEIAERDLANRGPGGMFSPRQHGLPDLKLADIIADYPLLVKARKQAFEIVDKDPTLAQHPNLRVALQEKFGDLLDLGGIG